MAAPRPTPRLATRRSKGCFGARLGRLSPAPGDPERKAEENLKHLPFFKWYPSDALSDIAYASLDLPALGLFHACLNYSWVNDGLPSDPLVIARLLRIEKQKFMKIWAQIDVLFPQQGGGLRRNYRQELEREGVYQKSASASKSAKARYERSANAQDTRARQIQKSDTDTEEEKSAAAPPVSKILPLPVRRALPPPSKLNGQGPEWAARLYARHPKKKDEALVPGAIFAVMESAPSPAALFAEIDRVHALWCATFDWQEKNGRFAPVLASWILDHGWTVEPKPEISKEDYDLAEYDRANGKI